jgi:hypothetical protein
MDGNGSTWEQGGEQTGGTELWTWEPAWVDGNAVEATYALDDERCLPCAARGIIQCAVANVKAPILPLTEKDSGHIM